MLIKYTGSKETKRVEFNNKTYIFNPTCEVDNEDIIKFLLSSERQDLFKEVVKEKKELKSKKRGRPKKGN